MNENQRRGVEGNYVWEGDGGGAGDVTRSSGENGEEKTKAEGRKSAALKRKKKRREGTSKGSLLEKHKQISAKSHNKASLSLPKYLQERPTALHSEH